MSKGQSGFTIIELVIVIAVLGILAAVALPRFADLTHEAHTAKNQAAGGALAAAVNIVHAKWLVGGSTGTTVTLEGGTVVNVDAQGWPASGSAAPSSPLAAQNCVDLWNGILQSGAPTVATTTGSDYQAAIDGTTATQCDYTYQHDTGFTTRTITYDTATGAVNWSP